MFNHIKTLQQSHPCGIVSELNCSSPLVLKNPVSCLFGQRERETTFSKCFQQLNNFLVISNSVINLYLCNVSLQRHKLSPALNRKWFDLCARACVRATKDNHCNTVFRSANTLLKKPLSFVSFYFGRITTRHIP